MKNCCYEVQVFQKKNEFGRVFWKEFNTYEEAREYSDKICIEDERVAKCSIFCRGCLVIDIL